MSTQHRKRLGLALGGGVARGLAHVGVLNVFQEAGIPIDCVSGTSAGSIAGLAYCAGMSAEQIREYAFNFRWRRLLQPTWPSRGLVTFDRLGRWIVHEMGDLTFADLKIPLVVVATDLLAGAPVEIHEGRAALAVQASCSIPGVVTPVEWNGRLLCEGGMSDMLPVTALRHMGADYVIGVDIFSFKLRRSLGPLGYLWAGLEIALERSGGGIEQADCLIRPPLAGKTYLRFSKGQEMYEMGRQAALEKLDCIRDALGYNQPDV